jgi:phenylalanyl-tRNA synthetase alpha subunit
MYRVRVALDISDQECAIVFHTQLNQTFLIFDYCCNCVLYIHTSLAVEALIQESEPINNITPNIISHMNARLLHQPHHPLQIIKTKIADHFKATFPAASDSPEDKAAEFQLFDDLHPVVSTTQCFDDLLIPADHVGRQPSDT